MSENEIKSDKFKLLLDMVAAHRQEARSVAPSDLEMEKGPRPAADAKEEELRVRFENDLKRQNAVIKSAMIAAEHPVEEPGRRSVQLGDPAAVTFQPDDVAVRAVVEKRPGGEMVTVPVDVAKGGMIALDQECLEVLRQQEDIRRGWIPVGFDAAGRFIDAATGQRLVADPAAWGDAAGGGGGDATVMRWREGDAIGEPREEVSLSAAIKSHKVGEELVVQVDLDQLEAMGVTALTLVHGGDKGLLLQSIEGRWDNRDDADGVKE